jgi:hypothetical protein
VTFTIESPPEAGEKDKRRARLKMGITVEIIPTPPR